jgi:CRP-like cAMP-binding protein
MDKKVLMEVVKEVPMLAALTAAEAEYIVDNSRVLRIEKGKTVLSEGQLGHGLFIILSGMVTVRRNVFGGFPVLANVYKNEAVGEVGILTDQPASATVATTTECWFMLLPTERVRMMMKEGHPAIYKLLGVVVGSVQKRTLSVIDRSVDIFRSTEKYLDVFERVVARQKKR